LLLTAVQRQLAQDGKEPAPTLFRAAGRQLGWWHWDIQEMQERGSLSIRVYAGRL
jgi:hypothetical protein